VDVVRLSVDVTEFDVVSIDVLVVAVVFVVVVEVVVVVVEVEVGEGVVVTFDLMNIWFALGSMSSINSSHILLKPTIIPSVI
jgi:hypothetical protein